MLRYNKKSGNDVEYYNIVVTNIAMFVGLLLNSNRTKTLTISNENSCTQIVYD